MSIEDRRAANRLSEVLRVRRDRAPLFWRSTQDIGGVFVVMIFQAKRLQRRRRAKHAELLHNARGRTLADAFDSCADWVRKEWPSAPPGAPRGNTNAAGWPAKKAARLAQLHASI